MRNLRKIKKRLGVTLIEILVVISIIVVLVGIISSVVILARGRAEVAVDISNLHQLGVAGAIYASDYDDVPPLSVHQLLSGGYVDGSITASKTDETDEGLALSFRRQIGMEPYPDTAQLPKITYLGPGDGGWQYSRYQKKLDDKQNRGWLVDMTRAEIDDGSLPALKGRYQRLLFEGSVITRYMGVDLIDDGRGGLAPGVKFEWYFADREDE